MSLELLLELFRIDAISSHNNHVTLFTEFKTFLNFFFVNGELFWILFVSVRLLERRESFLLFNPSFFVYSECDHLLLIEFSFFNNKSSYNRNVWDLFLLFLWLFRLIIIKFNFRFLTWFLVNYFLELLSRFSYDILLCCFKQLVF